MSTGQGIAMCIGIVVIGLALLALIFWVEERLYRRRFNRESEAMIAALSIRFDLPDAGDMSEFSDRERMIAYRAIYGDGAS